MKSQVEHLLAETRTKFPDCEIVFSEILPRELPGDLDFNVKKDILNQHIWNTYVIQNTKHDTGKSTQRFSSLRWSTPQESLTRVISGKYKGHRESTIGVRTLCTTSFKKLDRVQIPTLQ